MLKKFIERPKDIGSIVPSSPFLAKAIVDLIPKDALVLEVGAGTGSITKELVNQGFTPDQLTICEYDRDFHKKLRELFPQYSIFCKDAGIAPTFLPRAYFDVIISGLPLRNFSQKFKKKIIKSLSCVAKNNGRIIQFTYGWTSPIPSLKGEKKNSVLMNIPPAHVWQYSFTSEIISNVALGESLK